MSLGSKNPPFAINKNQPLSRVLKVTQVEARAPFVVFHMKMENLCYMLCIYNLLNRLLVNSNCTALDESSPVQKATHLSLLHQGSCGPGHLHYLLSPWSSQIVGNVTKHHKRKLLCKLMVMYVMTPGERVYLYSIDQGYYSQLKLN